METNQPGQGPELSGNVLFYRRPEPLSLEAHGKIGVKQIEQPFGFLREAHAVPAVRSKKASSRSKATILNVYLTI